MQSREMVSAVVAFISQVVWLQSHTAFHLDKRPKRNPTNTHLPGLPIRQEELPVIN
jgi:hypothetical protein